MLFVAGLLTLLVLSNAGGDHVKGGDHIKGGSEVSQQAVSQEEIAPAPYSFNINTGASYGTKIVREEIGDSDGKVKGFYSITHPRGTQRVVEYQADNTGFHTNIKTSEPNIKTHSPSNAVIEAITKKGSSATVQPVSQVPHISEGKLHPAAGLHHAAVVPVVQNPIDASATKGGVKTASELGKTFDLSDLQVREPVAFPVIREPIAIRYQPDVALEDKIPISQKTIRRKVVKTIRRKTVPSEIQQTIKTVPNSQNEESYRSVESIKLALPDSKRVAPAPISVTKTGSTKTAPNSVGNSPYITIDGDIVDAGKEVIVLDDGSIVDAKDTSRRLGQTFASSSDSIQAGINQDNKYVRGSQVPDNDARLDFEAPVLKSGQILRPTEDSILVPGGPSGAPISLTESEIQNILSSGGVLEFPSDSITAPFGTRNVLVTQSNVVGREIPVRDSIIRSNVQSITTGARKPSNRITSSIDRKETDFKSQLSTSTIRGLGREVPRQGSIIVPGGPGGASVSLTESEIQSILSSGGVLEFPSDSVTGILEAKDVTQRKPVINRTPIQTVFTRNNIESLSRTQNARKPLTRIASSANQEKRKFQSQTPTSVSRELGGQVSTIVPSRDSILIPGGPGGAPISLTESEIQNILSSGGVLEFPYDSATGPSRTRDAFVTQNKPIVSGIPGQTEIIRSNVQSLTQTVNERKPETPITPVNQNRREFKSQTSAGVVGAQVSRTALSGESIVVPGGPGGSSFSLTESEIQSILSSGGVLEFPSDTSAGFSGVRDVLLTERRPVISETPRQIIRTRPNVQSVTQTSSERKPSAGVSYISDQKRRYFNSRTSTSVPGISGAQITGAVPGNSIIVPGGPGGASFSLTETEIQKILSTGGVLEFPSDSAVSGTPGQTTITRSNIQPVLQASRGRKPASQITTINQKREEFKTQTFVPGSTSGEIRGGAVSGESIIVPGGPRGESISLTESEIEAILSSGGVLEFPTDSNTGSFAVRNTLVTQTTPNIRETPGGPTFTRQNVQSVVPPAVLGAVDGTTTASGESVIVPGGPGGASISLTESEIQKILSSGGLLEFPSDSVTGSPQNKPAIIRTSPQTATRLNTQTSSARKPITSDKKRYDFKSQTSTIGAIGGRYQGAPLRGGSVVVPGGPGGASFTLTESEIQRILSSGGVLEFPSDSVTGPLRARDFLTTQRIAGLSGTTGPITTTRSNIQSVTQTSNVRKPATRITSAIQNRREFKSQVSAPVSRESGGQIQGVDLSGGSIVVPGGPGGASFSLTESEIQNILSSGGVLEFPTDSVPGSFQIPDALVKQRNPSISGTFGGAAITRSNVQSLPSPKKPTINIQPIVRTSSLPKPEIRAPSIVNQAGSLFGGGATRLTGDGRTPSDDSIVVQGAPGVPSLTLTKTEVERILSSGGVIEIPSDADAVSGQKFLLPTSNPSISTSLNIPQRSTDLTSQYLGAGQRTAGVSRSGSTGQRSSVRYTPSSLSSPDLALKLGLEESAKRNPALTQENVKATFSETQVKEPFQQIEQVKFHEVPAIVDPSISQTSISEDSSKQLQIKIDDVQPLQKKLTLESFSKKYLQEKIPVQIPGYVPQPSFMAPFNYRVPQISALSNPGVPIVQEQEKLEQILV